MIHLRILPDHQNLFFLKDIIESLEWLKMCFEAFAHTSRPPKTFFQKIYFWTSGVVKNVLWCICAYFQTTRSLFSKKKLFTIWSVLMHLHILTDHQTFFFKKNIFYQLEWLQTCFSHFRILPDHQKLFFKKDIFECLEWLKTCFDTFAHTSRPPEPFFF